MNDYKYLHIKKDLEARIAQGEFGFGRLPGERKLAEQYDVSYMTVRKAVIHLVNAGLLTKVPKKGVFVLDNRLKNKELSSQEKQLTLGYFLDKTIVSGISSPYYSLIFHAIENYAASQNFSVIYFSNSSESALELALEQVDGVIASCFPRIEDIIYTIESQVPVVVIDNSSSDKSIPSVILDNFNAEKNCTDYVCSLGHKRIGFMTGLENCDIGRSRIAGYKKGLKAHGLQIDEQLIFKGNYAFEAGLKGAEYFLSLDHPPTALICANDSMAMGAIKQIKSHGLSVPDDMSVIGFDNINVASYLTPALTTIAAPYDEMAKQAVDLLVKQVRKEVIVSNHVVLATQLIQRESCAALKSTTDSICQK